jgi:hypothetical protein
VALPARKWSRCSKKRSGWSDWPLTADAVVAGSTTTGVIRGHRVVVVKFLYFRFGCVL